MNFKLKEHIPVKQGLRPSLLTPLKIFVIMLKEHIPVKQGLRLVTFCLFRSVIAYSQRAYSSKTRIKTLHKLADKIL